MNLKTYGKPNKIKRTFQVVKERFVINPKCRARLKVKGIEQYTPKVSRREKIGAIGIATCIATPGTNWAIPIFYNVMKE